MRLFFLLLASAFMINAKAQTPTIISLPVIGGPETYKDITTYSLQIPKGVKLKENQVFICHGVYKTADKDTAEKAIGSVVKISGDLMNCMIPKANLKINVEKGDLFVFLTAGKDERKDPFYKLARHAIDLTSVMDSTLFEAFTSLDAWSEAKTQTLLQALVNDIHYTGTEMMKQNDGQQQMIEGGDFHGQPLFTAMQNITTQDLQHFLGYIGARPAKYAGGSWKISEIFATWMVNKTPKAVG